jgi:hypothetical protein
MLSVWGGNAMLSVSVIIRVALAVFLGWFLTAAVGLVVPVVLVLIVLAIEYSKAKRHSPTLPFVAAGFVFGIAWFTLTNLSVVVAIGTT